jgi:uncharacterized damage-inducible protein DinB
LPVSLTVQELLGYSDHERAKWREWVMSDPSRASISLQPGGGRFSTVGSLLDHVFLVERRHLARLQGGTPPDATGVAAGDVNALFAYADLVRANLRAYIGELDEAEAEERLSFSVLSGGAVTMTRRTLLVHMFLHEIRHLAQIALASRIAGQAPPGEHDYFYFGRLA